VGGSKGATDRESAGEYGDGLLSEPYRIFLPCARYLEPVVAGELSELGLTEVKETKAGVSCSGTHEDLYRICLWTRAASRVLLLLAEGPAATEEELYETAASIDWDRHFAPEKSLSVAASSAKSALHNTNYAALKIKDGIVDTFRRRCGTRPSVSTEDPDIRFYGRIERDRLKLYLDASGEALHKRGYRLEKTEAPLRETAAAAMLLKAGWPDIAADGGVFLDPMCGSGTLAIEAGLMATGTAPGLLRDSFGFESWKGHDPKLWQRVREEAEISRASARSPVSTPSRRTSQPQASTHENLPIIHASDEDPRAVEVCRENVRRAGLDELISVRVSDFRELDTRELLSIGKPAGERRAATGQQRTGAGQRRPLGLVACNPPYGIRLEDENKVRWLYEEFGGWLKSSCEGCRAAVLTAGKDAARYLGLRAERVLKFYNGSIEGALALFELDEKNEFRPYVTKENPAASTVAGPASCSVAGSTAAGSASGPTAGGGAGSGIAPQVGDETSGVQSIVNRLRKNLRNLKKYLKRRDISCYRIYDADIPQYAAAVDVYEDTYFVIQEYAPPKTVDEESAAFRLRELTQAVVTFFRADESYVFVKQRRRRRGGEQYEKLSAEGEFYIVKEGGLRFFVNFTDYLDTGLFLDHRIAREMIRERAEGRDVLNLFAYTCTASVYAAAGGAASVVSVDTSNTYLEWGRKNFGLNRLGTDDAYFVREDAVEYLRRHSAGGFGLIFIDPPTYSNRKEATADFDVQRDHEELILRAAELLAPDGSILFSNNFRRFELSPRIEEELSVRDVSQETVPKDFSRNAKIHHAWIIELAQGVGRV